MERNVPPFSTQDIVDNVFPGIPDCRGNLVVNCLQRIARDGVHSEASYPYTGNKAIPPPQIDGDVYHIDGWKVIKDEENEIKAALEKQPIPVTIPYVSAVISYKGEIFGINADRQYIRGHTVLLVGYGTFSPTDSQSWPYEPINYWIIKNQWGKKWGLNGYGYIAFNSSVAALDSKRGRRSTRDRDEVVGWNYSPVVPLLRGPDEPELMSVSNVLEITDKKMLLDLVQSLRHREKALNILFYTPEYCAQHWPNLLKDFDLVSSVYEHDKGYNFAKVNMANLPTLLKLFQKKSEPAWPVALLALAATGVHARSPKDAAKFPNNKPYTFEYMARWLGKQVGGLNYQDSNVAH